MTEKQTQPSAIAQAAAREIFRDKYFRELVLDRAHEASIAEAQKIAEAAIDKHIAPLTQQLAECYRLSGADPDGNEDWRLAEKAVQEVKRLREESDATDEELLKTEAEIERLTKQLEGK